MSDKKNMWNEEWQNENDKRKEENYLKESRKRKREREELISKVCLLTGAVTLFSLAVFLIVWFPGRFIYHTFFEKKEEVTLLVDAPDYNVQLLTPNEYSRPQLATDPITGIVIHYTANPGTSAVNNRDYFEGLKDTHLTKTSAHFIVGIEGEIVQCIPTAEVAYASNDRNHDTVSIETCYINEDGSYEEATYESLVHLTAWLMGKFNLKTDSVIRHYDITGKNCPLYFVEHEDVWEEFKRDVAAYIAENGKEPPKEEQKKDEKK